MATETNRELLVGCALRLFGESGVEATSLREVAKAAGVSPALIVHHFGGKEGLVAAVDEAALRDFTAIYASEEPKSGPELLRRRAEQTVAVMRQRPDVCAYLGRALVEGTPGTAHLFRLMIDGARARVGLLADQGMLRADADHLWSALHHFFLIIAPLSFRALIEQEALGGSLFDEENLDRWVDSTVELMTGGLYR